jgi:hypothetical protein
MVRYGRGRARLARKVPATIGLPSVVPSLWLLWLVTGSVIGLFVRPVGIAVLASLAAYLLVVLAESVRVWRAERGLALRCLPAVFAAIHLGFGWGYLREAMAGIGSWPAVLMRRLFVPPWLRRVEAV